MKRIFIKEGPVVFLRNLFVMEFLAAVIFVVLSFFENYGLRYERFGLNHYLSYDKFLIIVFSLFQLTYIVLLFVDWYFRYFEIREREIVRSSGFFFRRRKAISMFQVVSVEVTQSPLDRLTKHATLILEHANGRVTKIRNVANFDEYARMIKQIIENTERSISAEVPRLESLLKRGENGFIEFKETLRYDVRQQNVNKDIERAAAKTIAGFMNAEGGTLLIGVDDRGQIHGLKSDYETLPKKNRDGFENHLNMLIKNMIGMKFANYVNIFFDEHEQKEVCIVSVARSHKPAYVRTGSGEDFFVRTGNSTQPFSMSEAEDYIKSRWR
jgi:membrane protein YdbS with pleckstrin-like domain